MLKKILILLMLAVLFSINVSALPSVDSITMCQNIQTTDEPETVTCQGVIDPPERGNLDGWAYFDIIISDMTDDDIVVVYIYDPEGGLEQNHAYYPEELIDNHVVYSMDVSEKEAGVWKLSVLTDDLDDDPDAGLFEIDSLEFTIIYEETRECNAFEGEDYFCCESPLVCPRGNRIAAGTCTEGTCAPDTCTCCDAEANCQPTIPGTITRTEINCAEAGLQNCERVAGSLYNYSIHGPLDKSVTIELEVRDIDISCFDKTDVAIGYYDEANERWVALASYVIEVAEGIYQVSALIDYLGYVGVIKTGDCVEIACTAGGYQFEPTSGYVDFEETIKFKICGLVPGCDATQDASCDERCPEGMDPDCTQTSCANTNDNCCLISKDDVCDPDCDPAADPDCCDKTKEGCCPGNLQRSGSQGCDKNCGLADEACTALENGCTSAEDDCCYPASDGACDSDCSPIQPYGGNPDPDCGDKTSEPGDSCNPVTDGICDLDCVFGVDADCRGGYVPYCGSGFCDPGETHGCDCGSCGPECTCDCGWGGGTVCTADCGTYYGTCNCPSDRSLLFYYQEEAVWKRFGHLNIRDIHYHTEVIEPLEGMFEGNNPKLLVNSIYSKFSPSVIDKEGEITKQNIFSKIINFILSPFVKEASAEDSTPIIAINTGQDYILDNDFMFGNPTSYNTDYETAKNFYETDQMKNGDKYILKVKPEITDGKIKLRILEYEYEETFLDKLELYAIKHDNQIFVKDDYTEIYALNPIDLVYPTSCKTSEGENCMPYLNNEEKDLVLDKDQYIDLIIEGKKIRIVWTDTHKLDSVALLKDGTEYPFELKKLKLTKAYSHRLGQDFKENLLEKDFDYLHTIRGDVVDLEFDAGEADDYLLESEGFYTNLRAYLYPDIDFDYVEKFIEPKQANE